MGSRGIHEKFANFALLTEVVPSASAHRRGGPGCLASDGRFGVRGIGV